MQRFLNQLMPFLLICIAILAFTFGMILFAYFLLFFIAIGLILYAVSWIRHKFFPPKTAHKPTKKSGRVIDSDDWKQL